MCEWRPMLFHKGIHYTNFRNTHLNVSNKDTQITSKFECDADYGETSMTKNILHLIKL